MLIVSKKQFWTKFFFLNALPETINIFDDCIHFGQNLRFFNNLFILMVYIYFSLYCTQITYIINGLLILPNANRDFSTVKQKHQHIRRMFYLYAIRFSSDDMPHRSIILVHWFFYERAQRLFNNYSSEIH